MQTLKAIKIVVFIILVLFLYQKDIENKVLEYKLTPQVYLNIIIYKYATQYDIDIEILKRLIYFESRYKINAISNKQAFGLMQLRKITVIDIKKRLNIKEKVNILDIENNIKFGCYYLRYLLNYYKNDYRKTLIAYNMGLSKFNKTKKYNNVTKKYINNILNRSYDGK